MQPWHLQKKNLDFIRKSMTIQTIGYDKINQYRHVKYFKDLDGIKAKMKQHADILRPKFEMVDEILTKELEGLGIGTWTKPLGGYFITFETLEGCATSVVKKQKRGRRSPDRSRSTIPIWNRSKRFCDQDCNRLIRL